jgi:hypothetical protein
VTSWLRIADELRLALRNLPRGTAATLLSTARLRAGVTGAQAGREVEAWLDIVGLGLVAAAFFARLRSVVLFGVAPFDPATFAVVAVVVLGICGLSALVPSLRALRVNPATALRYE